MWNVKLIAGSCYTIIRIITKERIRNMKQMIRCAISLVLAVFLIGSCACAKDPQTAGSDPAASDPGSQNETLRLTRDDWAPDVKTAVNDLIEFYSESGKSASEAPYAVFDISDASPVFDVQAQIAVYQLQTMAFAISQDKLKTVLATGLKSADKNLSDLGFGNGSLNNWITDVSSAYKALWTAYGPFSAEGVSEEIREEMQEDPQWIEFATKMRAMYSLVFASQSEAVANAWASYWYTGMTEEEIYALASAGIAAFKDREASVETWTSPDSIKSKVGVATCEWKAGIQIPENVSELWNALSRNGIDVWACSAYCTGVTCAAIDAFGLHDSCTGILGWTNKSDKSGKYQTGFDLETGSGYYANLDGSWTRMTRPTKARPLGSGIVTAIENVIAPQYGDHGPVAGFMDSSHGFNFCTEFETLKLVICLNDADRAVTDGAGLIAEVAVYERDTLGYDLAKAVEAGDTLYLLQGLDKTDGLKFRNSSETILPVESDGAAGSEEAQNTEEKLFAGEENQAQLSRMTDEAMPVADILNTWSLIQPAEENGFEFATGFLSEYAGYHTHP